MITRMNDSKISTKHISSECKCKFDCRKYNSNQKWKTINVDASVKIKKPHNLLQKRLYLEPCYM